MSIEEQIRVQERRSQDRILRWHELHDKVNLGRSTVWRMERDGLFPRRRQISPGSVGWLASEVDAWLQSRVAV